MTTKRGVKEQVRRRGDAKPEWMQRAEREGYTWGEALDVWASFLMLAALAVAAMLFYVAVGGGIY